MARASSPLLLPLAALAAVGSLGGSLRAQEPGWLDRVHFFADGRLRAEFNDNLAPSPDRHRGRMRFRFGATFDVEDDLVFGFRMRTGDPNNPINPYADFGGGSGFTNLALNLDRLYADWRPSWLDDGNFRVLAGKFDSPHVRNPIYGELLLDADFQPEGVQFAWKRALGEATTFGVTHGQWIQIENGASEDAWMSLTQAHVLVDADSAGSWDFVLTYEFVGDPTPDGATAITARNRGNAVVGGEFASDFGVLNPMVVWNRGAITVVGEYFDNLRAATGAEDNGFAFGGKLKTGYGQFWYQYQQIGQDALFSPWVQDDFLLAVNAKTHALGWKKMLGERTQLHVWLMASEADDPALGGPADMVYRFRTDFSFDLL